MEGKMHKTIEEGREVYEREVKKSILRPEECKKHKIEYTLKEESDTWQKLYGMRLALGLTDSEDADIRDQIRREIATAT
jgi:hypothetical protein